MGVTRLHKIWMVMQSTANRVTGFITVTSYNVISLQKTQIQPARICVPRLIDPIFQGGIAPLDVGLQSAVGYSCFTGPYFGLLVGSAWLPTSLVKRSVGRLILG
jgi:hypothetical protein